MPALSFVAVFKEAAARDQCRAQAVFRIAHIDPSVSRRLPLADKLRQCELEFFMSLERVTACRPASFRSSFHHCPACLDPHCPNKYVYEIVRA